MNDECIWIKGPEKHTIIRLRGRDEGKSITLVRWRKNNFVEILQSWVSKGAKVQELSKIMYKLLSISSSYEPQTCYPQC